MSDADPKRPARGVRAVMRPLRARGAFDAASAERDAFRAITCLHGHPCEACGREAIHVLECRRCDLRLCPECHAAVDRPGHDCPFHAWTRARRRAAGSTPAGL